MSKERRRDERHKVELKQWHPRDQRNKLFPQAKLISDEAAKSAHALIGEQVIDYDKFRLELQSVEIEFEWGRRDHDRPSAASLRDEFDKLSAAIKDAYTKLEKVSPFALTLLSERLSPRHGFSPPSLKIAPYRDSLGELNDACAWWDSKITNDLLFERLGGERRRGAPADQHMKLAAKELVALWTRVTGKQFVKNFRDADHHRARRFDADCMEFVKVIIKDLGGKGTTDSIRHIVTEALKKQS